MMLLEVLPPVSILANTIQTLETDIQEAQSLLTHLKSMSSASSNGIQPSIRKKNKAAKPGKVTRKDTPAKAWTPEHRANYMRTVRKMSRAKKKAAAAPAADAK
jgi:hypothetical protein